MEWLLAQDRALLLLINGGHSPAIDTFMYVISEKWAWLPLYAALLVLLYKQYGWRATALTVVVVALVILVCDQMASGLLKPLVQRPRPCHVPELASVLHLVDDKCGGKFGFASSHAANFFGLATFIGWSLRQKYRWLGAVLFTCAGLVAYSRVYMGVHYPTDVFAGAAIGILMGMVGILLFKISLERLNFPQSETKSSASR